MRPATLASGQTSGAARRNQALEQSRDGASRATHEGMPRNPPAQLAVRERTDPPPTGQPMGGGFPGQLSSFGSGAWLHRATDASAPAVSGDGGGNERTSKGVQAHGRHGRRTAGNGGTSQRTRQRSKASKSAAPPEGVDCRTWQRAKRKAPRTPARGGYGRAVSAATPRTSSIPAHLCDVGVRFGGSEHRLDPGNGPPARSHLGGQPGARPC
jgi:hypothetical protein